MNRIGDIEITVPGLPLLKDFCGKHAVFLKACSRLSGALLLACTVLIVILLLSFDVYGMLTTARTYQYELGGDMINYAAGFVRRGLFGEIVYFLNQVFQPFVSVLIMSFVSILFMLYVLIARMVRLNMRLPYILAVVLSPSLVLMHRDQEMIRTDLVVIALNLAALCFLLRVMFTRRHDTEMDGHMTAGRYRQSFAGMLFIDAVIFTLLAVSALIHELSVTLLPPLMILFFIYTRRVHRTMHCVAVSALLIAVYALMMAFFKFRDASVITESWSGIFPNYDGSPELWHHIPRGMAAVVSREYALFFVHRSMDSLPDFFMINMITAVAEPFIILLLSGITVFHSSSWRCRVVRCLILISCLGPLCLSLVAYDYGRWFSFSAIQLTVYVLMLSHSAGRTRRMKNTSDIRKMLSLTKMCLVIAIMVHFVDSRMGWPGYFITLEDKDSFLSQTRNSIACLPETGELIKQILTRELIVTP